MKNPRNIAKGDLFIDTRHGYPTMVEVVMFKHGLVQFHVYNRSFIKGSYLKDEFLAHFRRVTKLELLLAGLK